MREEIETTNAFILKTMDTITDEYAKTLVDKHIHFTWHNNSEHTIETIPGKVLSYGNNKLIIDTMDIFFDDNDESDNWIKEIDIKDITNVYAFDNYTKDCFKLLEDIETFNDKIFKITNIFGDKIETKIIDENSPLSITIIVGNDNYEYPLYFIKEIKQVD
ncbi:MAG: hypothetical protein IJ565_04705 [Bacilli bacterium]|nr:hypothetical protein [Bacilli bacterium]